MSHIFVYVSYNSQRLSIFNVSEKIFIYVPHIFDIVSWKDRLTPFQLELESWDWMKLCPSCKSVQRDKAVTCSVCGTSLDPDAAPPKESEDAPPVTDDETSSTPAYESEAPNEESQEEEGQDEPAEPEQEGPNKEDDVQDSIYEIGNEESSIYQADPDTIYSDDIYGSEEDKEEILEQIEDLKSEGWKVSRLEKALENEPDKIWDILAQYMIDVEGLLELQTKMRDMDYSGYEADAKVIMESLDDPDKVEDIKVLIGFLEKKIAKAETTGAALGELENTLKEEEERAREEAEQKLREAAEMMKKAQEKGSEEEHDEAPSPEEEGDNGAPVSSATTFAIAKKKGVSLLEVIKKLTLARNSFTDKNYNRAKAIYEEILELDPTNDEAKYYMDKIDEELKKNPDAGGDPVKVMMPKKILAPKMVTAPKVVVKPKEEEKEDTEKEQPGKEAKDDTPSEEPGEEKKDDTPSEEPEEEEGAGDSDVSAGEEPEEKPEPQVTITKPLEESEKEEPKEKPKNSLFGALDEDPMLKEDILNDLAGVGKKAKPKKKGKKKGKKEEKEEEETEEAPEEDDAAAKEEEKKKLAQLDARAFKATINKDWETAIDYYQQILKIDPDFKNAKKKLKECREKAGPKKGKKKPVAKKKKKAKKK